MIKHRKRAIPRLGRPFGLLDAMILVIALAPAFVVLRDRFQFYGDEARPSVFRTVSLSVAVFNSVMIALTLALTAMILRKPRGSLGMVARLPGPAACYAGSLSILVITTRMVLKCYTMFALAPGESFHLRYVYPWVVGKDLRVGFAVIGAWVMLAMTGLGRSEPSWIDTSGRVIGWGWVAQLLFFVALPWFEPYLPAI